MHFIHIVGTHYSHVYSYKYNNKQAKCYTAGLGPILSCSLKSWKFLVLDPAAKRMKENYTCTAPKTDMDIGGLYGTVYTCGHHFPVASAIDTQIWLNMSLILYA